MIKICSSCRQRLPLERFYRTKKNDATKRTAVCKLCWAKLYNAKKREREKRRYWDSKCNDNATNNDRTNLPRMQEETTNGDVLASEERHRGTAADM